MKLKKLLAAAVASALAVTTMAVTSFTASAADQTATGTHTVTGTVMSYTDEDNKVDYVLYEISDAQIKAAASLGDVIVKSISDVSVNYTASDADIGGFVIAHGASASNGYWMEQSITIDSATATDVTMTDYTAGSDGIALHFKVNTPETNLAGGKTITINSVSFTVTYADEAVSGTNFSYSKLTDTAMTVGDTFTITYESAKTPSTTKYKILYEFYDDEGTANDWVPVVNTDGTINNGKEDVTGLKVTSSTSGTKTIYTFTATKLSTKEFMVKIAVSASGDVDAGADKIDVWKDGMGKYKVTTASSTPVTPEGPSEGGDTPSTSKTHEGSVDITADNGWGATNGTPTMAELIGDLDASKTTIVFTGASLVKVGYNSVKTPPNEENSKWFEVEAVNGKVTIDASDIVTDGYWISIAVSSTSTVTWVATEGGSGSGGTTTPPVDPTPENPAPTTPSAPTTSTPAPSNNPTPVSQTTIVDTILATPDSGKSTVNLGSSTKVDKLAIEAIATKGDVTIKLSVAGGAYWEINGKNVTDAKNVDLGVRVNSKQIPESKVEAFAGDKTTVQLSLSHNGDLGFTGTLNVPVGNSNNGKFANLYYYHNGKFDFVGSSAISGGRTQFAFSHASNYLIVIDDYAYGEDVSSAAGMTETATETSSFPYVAVLVVIAAFGTSAMVLKKRLSK